MIFPEEKEKLKKAIGRGYSKRFLKWLEDKNVKNEKGKNFSAEMIINVMNGYSHEKLESLLFEYAEYCINEKEKQSKRREKILSQIK